MTGTQRAEIHVSVAGKPHRPFGRRVFQRAGLYTLGDFARGENYLSGTDFKIVLRQTRSADNYGTRISVGYQFIVESQ
jgi:hypothetical protein